MDKIEFKEATIENLDEIMELIHDMAVHVDAVDEVVATKEKLEYWLFEKKVAKDILMYVNNKLVGHSLYYYTFSTFLGNAGIFLEDLIVKKEYRGKGYGHMLISNLAKVCIKENLGRLEWECLEENTGAKKLYNSLPCYQKDNKIYFRSTGDDLKKMAKL